MISVRFPDGSLRDVPSELHPVEADRPYSMRFHHRPIAHDGQWRFVESTSGWIARPRYGSLTILDAPVEEWWRGIATMADVPQDSATKASRAA